MKEYAFQGDLDQYFNLDHALVDFRWPLFSRGPEQFDTCKQFETAMEAGFPMVRKDKDGEAWKDLRDEGVSKRNN